jgi:hypothetical protein
MLNNQNTIFINSGLEELYVHHQIKKNHFNNILNV